MQLNILQYFCAKIEKMITQKIRIAPRWFIYLIDLFCILGSILVAFFIRLNFDINRFIADVAWGEVLTSVILINSVFLFLFKNYRGVVRYTTLEDSKRIILLTASISVVYLIFNYTISTDDNKLLFPLTVVAINFLCANFALLVYRIIIKTVYENVFALRKKSTKAIIYNAGFEGMLAKRMFSDNERSSIKIVSFIDDNPRIIGKKLENVPVFSATKQSLMRLKNEGTEMLIIADPFISKDRLNHLVDICLENGIQIRQVPPSEKWANNQLDAAQLTNINIDELLDREVISIQNEGVKRELRGKKVLVTGAAGSIGSEIVRQVLKFNPAVVILCDIAETPLHELMLQLESNAQVRSFVGDIKDRVRMEQIFEIYEPDIVYHAAAYKHVPLMEQHPSAAIVNNVMGTQILAELSVAYGVEKFVMVSTDKAVNPTNVMGASKRIAEIFTQSYHKYLSNTVKTSGLNAISHTKFITTRFGNVLGSNGSVIPHFKKQLEEGGPLTVTHPEITRYFMTIPEACQLVLEAGAMGKGGEIFVFDMGQPVKIVDLAKKMIHLSGRVPDVDIKITFTGLRPGEKLYEELLNNSENALPTYHEKILIAQVREYDFSLVRNEVESLIKLAQKHVVMDTVAKMKEIVPEFISNNSTFSKLDK